MATVASLVIAPQDDLGDQVLDLAPVQRAPLPALFHLRHPVAAYLSGLTASSRPAQLAALDAIARSATAVYSAETLPWHQLRRPHALRIRQLLEDQY